jgi:hypothetical protein
VGWRGTNGGGRGWSAHANAASWARAVSPIRSEARGAEVLVKWWDLEEELEVSCARKI